MDPIYYLYIGLGVALLAYVGMLSWKIVRNKKRKNKEEQLHQEKVEKNLDVVDDVRYTMEQNPVNPETGAVNATYQQNDFILPQNTPVTVSQNGELKPGKYIMLSSSENQESFNVRVGIYVREYKHNQEIVLAEGDTICAVSCQVILR